MKNISLICYWHIVEKILAPADDKLFCFHFQFSLLVLQSKPWSWKIVENTEIRVFCCCGNLQKMTAKLQWECKCAELVKNSKVKWETFLWTISICFLKRSRRAPNAANSEVTNKLQNKFFSPKRKLFKFSTKDQVKIKVLPWYIPDILTEVSQPETLH